MNLKINRKDLIETLSLGGAMSGDKSKTGISLLVYAKVTINQKQIVVTSNDINTHVTKRLLINGFEGEKIFCVSSNDTVRALKTLGDEEITLSIEDDSIVFTHSSGTMEFPIFDATDFPVPLKSEKKFEFTMSASALGTMISLAKNFAANDLLRPVLNGIYLAVDGNKVEVCASDGARLFYDMNEFDGNSAEKMYVIIPSTACDTILNTIYREDVVRISINRNNAVFSVSNGRVVTTIIDGKYPNFYLIIPKDNKISITTDRNLLLQKIQRISLFSTNTAKHKFISLDIKGNNMVIKGEDREYRKKGKETLSIMNACNDEIKIGLGAVATATSLNSISGDNVTINMSSPDRAITYKDEERPNMVILQMPILL